MFTLHCQTSGLVPNRFETTACNYLFQYPDAALFCGPFLRLVLVQYCTEFFVVLRFGFGKNWFGRFLSIMVICNFNVCSQVWHGHEEDVLEEAPGYGPSCFRSLHRQHCRYSHTPAQDNWIFQWKHATRVGAQAAKVSCPLQYIMWGSHCELHVKFVLARSFKILKYPKLKVVINCPVRGNYFLFACP